MEQDTGVFFMKYQQRHRVATQKREVSIIDSCRTERSPGGRNW